MIIHVKKGDNLYTIAKEYGISTRKAADDNALRFPNKLIPGMELLLLRPTRCYTVRRGDTLSVIAKRFGISEKAILRQNPMLDGRNALFPGQILSLSHGENSRGALALNGYVFPGCDNLHFERALCRCSYLTFSCAESDGVRISFINAFGDYRKRAKAENILCLCRLSLSHSFNLEIGRDTKKAVAFADEVSKVVTDMGFDGLTTAFPTDFSIDADSALCQAFKTSLKDKRLLWFNETNGNENQPIIEYADATVLMYDKGNVKNPPSFEEGEKALLESYEKTGKASKIMVEISPFAYRDGVPVPKEEAVLRAVLDGGEIRYDDKTKLCTALFSEGCAVYESHENNKAKFDLCDELGFMGIALDVNRTDVPLYMLAATEFAPVDYVFYSVKDM